MIDVEDFDEQDGKRELVPLKPLQGGCDQIDPGCRFLAVALIARLLLSRCLKLRRVLPRSAVYVGACLPLGASTEFIAQRLPQALRQQVCSLSCPLQALVAGRTEGCRGHLRVTRNWVCGRAVAHTC